MKTQATMLTAVRERLDEASARFWDDVMLRRWINEGARDVARKTETLYVASSAIDIVAGTQTYTGSGDGVPTDILRIKRAQFQKDNDDLIYPLTFRDFNAMDSIWWTSQGVTQGTPGYFTFRGFSPSISLLLYPTPDANGSVVLNYYRLPAELATADNSDANDAVECPEGWEDLIIDYCEYMALRRDGDPDWQATLQKYEANLEAMYGLTRSISDQPGIITPAEGGGALPGWLTEPDWGYW